MKTCKCGNSFEPYKAKNSAIEQSKCFECLVEQGRKMRTKEIKTNHKVLKEKVRNERPVLEKRLEREVNAICRLIDKGCACISCSFPGNSAGHRHSVGSNPSLRYNLHNIHIQEQACNINGAGNLSKYDQGLEKIYGDDYKEYVVFEIVRLYPALHLSQPELKEAIVKARKAKNELLIKNKEYSPSERRLLRNHYNQQIGIYK